MNPRLKPGEIHRIQLAVFISCGSQVGTAGISLRCHYVRVDWLSV